MICSSAALSCVFDTSGLPATPSDGSVDAPIDASVDAPVDASPDAPVDAPVDASIDAPVPVCTPGETYCDGRVLQTCNTEGTGPDVGLAQTCDFACATDACVVASDIPAGVYTSCDDTAPALAPVSGTTVRFERSGPDVRVTCSADCGNGSTTIDAIHTAATPPRAWFCFSSVTIPTGVTVTAASNLPEAIVWLVDGTTEIAGNIGFGGRNAANNAAGAGGPGGGAGGARANASGNDGQGPCPGRGGSRVGLSSQAGGGGGGGGYGGVGGDGGTGRHGADLADAPGGAGGADTCGNPEIIPLVGGSGGGSGGDGSCGGDCGWPGGGGGGAIQIASRTSITITGNIITNGGGGHGETSGGGEVGGGGGGGSGGAILLDSPDITISGFLLANGGNGGTGAGGPGGAGGALTMPDGSDGASYMSSGQGGSGGGGGGGRIRINTLGNSLACGSFASPEAICTSGDLPAAP